MKRIVSFLLTLALICSVFPAMTLTSGAYSETDVAYPVEGGNIYFDKETGTITDCDSSVTSADIPAEIEGVSVTSIGEDAFLYCSSLTDVTIPNSVTSIGSRVFSDCSSLMTVTLPNSLTSIEIGTFAGCSSLTSVTLPNSVTSIGAYAFQDCSSLTSIVIPDGVKSIGYSAFNGCSSLASVTIPDSVTSISPQAFENTALYNEEDHWTGDVLYIDNWLIKAKSSLEGAYIVLPGTVGIADSAFTGCGSLTSITIPKEVVSIATGVYASFHFCPKLSDIVVVEENTAYAAENGVLFNKEKTTLLNYPMGKADTAYVIPSGVTSIADWAFYGSAMEGITIPETVKHIGKYAFNHCSGLTEVTIPDGVVSIGSEAFEYCEKLSSVTISDTVTSIDGYAFAYSALTSVELGNGITNIGVATFYACEKLTSITIPESVTSIDAYAFGVCTGLENINIPASVSSIGSSAFEGCGFTNVTIPESVTSIGDYAFCYCNDLTSVYFMGNAPEVGESAFQTWVESGLVNIPGLTLYYIDGKEGWTSPTWNGYPAATWAPHEHTYTETVTAPTCTEQGYTTHTCECGDSYVDTYVDALGHDYKDGVCTVCGAKDPDYKPAEPVKFTDVTEKAWYYGAVEYAVQNGLMKGVGNDQFDPEGTMTRAMLVTVLWRYEGEPEAPANTFSDVKAGSWYFDAVSWAAANNIVGGVGDNKFDPDGNITREQMATILYRYCNGKGIDTSKQASLSGFPDAGKVSSYAQTAMQWAVAEKLVNGSDGKLLPQGNATRAQVATILMRFIENIAG